jgi:DNA-binding cell septation regulator SpoVG
MDKQEGGGMGSGRFVAMVTSATPGNEFADVNRHPAGDSIRQSLQ